MRSHDGDWGGREHAFSVGLQSRNLPMGVPDNASVAPHANEANTSINGRLKYKPKRACLMRATFSIDDSECMLACCGLFQIVNS